VSKSYRTRITKLVVLPKGEPLFSEQATEIEIEDEAAGEFVKVTQQGGSTEYSKSICFEPEEWPTIKKAIDLMIGRCRKHE
jgi:hypothetical protein